MAPKYDRDEIARLVAEGLTTKQVMARLGCSSSPVLAVRRSLGLRRPRLEESIETRLERARYFLEVEGWGYRMVTQVISIDKRTLRRRFPGHEWSRQQIVEASAMSRALNRIPDRLERTESNTPVLLTTG